MKRWQRPLLWLKDVEKVRHGALSMRAGEDQFHAFMDSIRGYEHVRGATFNIVLASGQKVRISLRNEGKLLWLVRLVKEQPKPQTNKKRR